MDFRLNEYRQGVTDEELLDDVKRVSLTVGDKYLSYSVYKSIGKYSEKTFTKRFGSWPSVLEKVGLPISKPAHEMKRIADEEIINDIQRVGKELSSATVTSKEYSRNGRFAFPTVIERFGNWAAALEKSGLSETDHIPKIEDIDLFFELEKTWISLGRQPTTTDMRNGISKYSLDTFMRRFGGWRNALCAFIEYMNSPNVELETEETSATDEVKVEISKTSGVEKTAFKKRTPRNINLKLRFAVLQRDRFTCISCGRSPAKEPGVELHVDHIVPWSRGGETEIANLQILCSKCNLGKSDNEFS